MRNINHRSLESRIKQAKTRKILFAEGKITSWNKGKVGVYSKEALQKMSDGHKGKILPEEQKLKISKNNARYWSGKQRSEETKQKISKSKEGGTSWIKGLNIQANSGRTHFKKGHVPWSDGKKYSEGLREKLSHSHKGKKHTEETKKKISLANKGKHRSPECILKIQTSRGVGENHVCWKGGKRLVKRRVQSKRRQLGFIPLNDPENGWEAHHLDGEYVLYVPKNIHHCMYHALKNKNKMDKINEIVIDWYITYYSLI